MTSIGASTPAGQGVDWPAMMLRMRQVLALVLCGAAAALQAAEPDYAVVVSAATRAEPGWREVVDTLAARHHASVASYDTSVDEVLPALRRQFPRYVCFVARPAEAGRDYIGRVHRLTRRLDDDPYADCFWGVLTGYDASNALAIARQSAPLVVRKAASGTELAMDCVSEGVWYCELNKNKRVRKAAGGKAVQEQGPDDTTEALVKVLNEEQPDMFVTSGHATERDWMIGFKYRNGFFKHDRGLLYGLDTRGAKWPVASPNPKVYLAVGNCLMGHIDRPDCMALAWMNSAGVCQMAGYTVPSWYGYMGWGLLDYFVEQPGRHTLAEAFLANQHALINRLTVYFPGAREAGEGKPVQAGPAAKAAGLSANDARGLLYDRDTVAFYGDPKWLARMADGPRSFEQTLTEKDGVHTFEIRPNLGDRSFDPVNRNGSQRGGRPFIAFFPRRVGPAQVREGASLAPVIADDFILVPNPGRCDPAQAYRVVFAAAPL